MLTDICGGPISHWPLLLVLVATLSCRSIVGYTSDIGGSVKVLSGSCIASEVGTGRSSFFFLLLDLLFFGTFSGLSQRSAGRWVLCFLKKSPQAKPINDAPFV